MKHAKGNTKFEILSIREEKDLIMKIDRNNYEIYFMDYMEGKLSAEETAELLLFVDKNPDLKRLIEGDELISLVPDKTIKFYPKSALKRKSSIGNQSDIEDTTLLNAKTVISALEINSQQYEELMIRYYDNDLNDAEKTALANFLKDSPTFIKAFELFGNTLLKPDTGIIYPHKSRLKRNIFMLPGVKKVLTIISVAAAILLFSTLFLKYFNQPAPKHIDKQFAQTFNRNSQTGKVLIPKGNTTEIKSTEINRSNSATQLSNTSIRKTNSSKTTIVERKGGEPSSKHLPAKTIEKTTIEVPTLLIIRQTPLLATIRISAPPTIERRTDFDGITSSAYFDPDPDALPLRTDGKTIGGRLGYTLAQGLTQTAGTIAREPEISRLLRGKISVSDIASLGLAGFNLITDSKLSISRDYDSDGNLSGYSIKDGDRRLTRLP